MSQISYQTEFVKRTKRLLETVYAKAEAEDLEITLLMNCLLGLIIAVSEIKKEGAKCYFKNNMDDEFIEKIPDKIGFILNKGTYDLLSADTSISITIGKKENLSKIVGSWFLQKIRNGIAHQNIEAINSHGKWTGVKIWNENKFKKKDFEIEFTNSELRDFSFFLASKHISDN